MGRTLLALCLMLSALFACAGVDVEKQREARTRQELGEQLFLEGDLIGATRELQTAAKADPENASALGSLGIVYARRELYDLAEESLKKSIELNPKSPDTRHNLAMVYVAQGRFDESIRQLEQAVSDLTYPSPHRSYTVMGMAYQRKGDLPKAADCYRQALKTVDDWMPALRGLGDVYSAQADWTRAAESYRQAVASYGSDAESHLGLGIAQAKLGNIEQARQAFEAAITVGAGTDAARKAKDCLDRLAQGEALGQ